MSKQYGLLSDFSGVMVYDGLASMARYEKRYGIASGRLQKAKDRIWCEKFRLDPNMGAYDFWKECFTDAEVMPTEFMINEINSSVLESHYPFEEMFAAVRKLKEHGVVTGMITNTSREWFQHFNRKHGLKGLFDVLAASYDIGIAKPSPKIYSEAGKMMGLDKGKILHLDDQQKNVAAGIENGYRNSHLFVSPSQIMPVLSDFFGVDL